MTGTPKNRIRRLTALGLVSLLGLSACGLSGSGGGSEAAVSNPDGELSGEITFQTWNLRANYEKYFKGIIADFTEKHPDVSVEWVDQPADGYAEKLQADAANGNLPDVVNIAPDLAFPLARAGVLMDLSKTAPEAKADYQQGAWADYSYPGMEGTYAFPWYLNTGPIFYNKKLFEKAGLNPEDPPSTFDELHQQALQMAKSADGNFYMLGALPVIEDFGMYGVQLMSEDGSKFTFNTPKAERIVEAYVEMYQKEALLPESTVLSYTGTGERFMSQQVALTTGSAYDLKNFKKNAPELYKNIGITEVITANGAAPTMYSQGLGVTANTDHPATAIAFARFVTNEANQLEFAKKVNIFPSTKGTLEKPYFTKDDGTDAGAVRVTAAEQLQDAVNHTPARWTEEMRVMLQRQIAAAVTGKQSAEEALDKTVAEANRILEAD